MIKRRNRIIMGLGIPFSLITAGVGVLAFYISLIFAIAIAFGGNSNVLADIMLYSSFAFIASGIIALVGSILTGFKSIPGGIILLISSIVSLINPIFLIVTTAIHSDSFQFFVILFVIPAIILWILGIWALCTKPKTVEPKIKINNNNNINVSVANNIPPQQSQLNEQPQQNENTQQNESNTEED